MKVVIAGSRTINSVSRVYNAIIDSDYEITEVVSGCAKGVDTIGEIWASWKNIPIKQFPADWKKYRSAAGPIRNKQMAEYCDAAIIVWNGDPVESPGSADMVKQMKKINKPYFEYRMNKDAITE